MLLTSVAPLQAQETPPPRDDVYIYYADELFSNQSPLPVGLRQLRREDQIFEPCRAAESHVAPWLVPIVLFGVKLFGSVVERHLSQNEVERIQSLSRTYAQVRADEAFPVQASGSRLRCLVVDRVSESSGTFTSGAVYVLALRPVGAAAFTVEPVAGRIDATPIRLRPRQNKLNATISVTFQSVVPNASGNQEQVTLPAYSMTFRDLTPGTSIVPPARRSAVMPIVRAGPAPTSVAVAVTESHASLDQVKQEIALEQANRAALLAAIGEAVKAAITD